MSLVGLGHGSGESDKLYSSPKMSVTDVTVGVTVTSRLHRSYCCSRIPVPTVVLLLLFNTSTLCSPQR